MKNKKTLFILLAMLGIVVATIGATYAFFSYGRNGAKGNTISSGSIKFHYEEKSQGLTLNEVMPMTDIEGMNQAKFFEFEITSKTSDLLDIPYYITVRRVRAEADMDEIVKVYLTRLEGNTEVPVELENGNTIATFSELGTYHNSEINIPSTERLLHRDVVFAGSSDYRETYRLRMWISDTAEFIIQEDGQPDVYPYQGKSYSLKVNVYGNGLGINQSIEDFRNNANVTDIELGSDVLSTSTDKFTSEVTFAPGEESSTREITVNTENPNSQVTIENLTQSAMNTNIKRLAASKTIDLVLGTNNFRVTVRSEDKRETKIYTLVITAKKPNYGVTLSGNNVTLSESSLNLDYGASKQITITPDLGYYISGGSCTNNYTITGLTTGVSATGGQTITISNANNVGSSICVFSTTAFTYAITYNLNSGTQGANPVTNYTVVTSTFDLPTPTRTGYTFNGWYETSNFTGSAVTQIATGTTGNKEYWAKWIAKTANITFDKQDGTGGTGNIDATYDSSMPTITVPTRTGYTFDGYYTGTSGTGTKYYTALGTSAKTSDLVSNTILYANWIINKYNVTVNSSVNGNKSSSGHSGFTFDVYVNNTLVANDVITYSTTVDYNTPVKVTLNDVANYAPIDSTIEKTITSETEITSSWITSTNIGIQFKYKNSTLIVITEGKTWEAAEAYAQSLGGHLAMIKTEDMQNYIYNTILSNQTVSGLASFWIGATDKASEGTWRWVDGTTLASTYSNWNTGEPNDSSGEDYCQYYISGNKGKWNDLNGAQSYPFVVQIGTP